MTISENNSLETLTPSSAAVVRALSESIEDPFELAFVYNEQAAGNIQVKGGAGWRPDWWEGFKTKMREFICGDSEDGLRHIVALESGKSGKEIAKYAAIYVAGAIGIEAGVIVGIAAIVVWKVIEMGLDAWCDATA